MGYTLADKDVMIGGSDESYVTDMEVDMILQGSFPQTDKEALVGDNAQKAHRSIPFHLPESCKQRPGKL